MRSSQRFRSPRPTASLAALGVAFGLLVVPPAAAEPVSAAAPLTAELIADLDNVRQSSEPQEFLEYQGTVYFSAEDGIHGRELWKLDPATGVASLVADIRPGESGSSPNDLIGHAGRVYFSARTDATGNELWSTDGTAAGTALVDDINPGSGGSILRNPVIFDGAVHLIADDRTSGEQIWRVTSPTSMTPVTDLNPGGDADLRTLFPAPGVDEKVLLFAADSGTGGNELHAMDGAGNVTQYDIEVGAGSSSPSDFVEFDGAVAFVAREGGTSTLHYADIVADDDITLINETRSAAARLVVSNDALYVSRTSPMFGLEVVETAGEAPIGLLSGGTVGRPVPISNGVVFAYDGANGFEMFFSGGTVASTEEIVDLTPGPSGSSFGSVTASSSAQSGIVQYDGRVWRVEDDAITQIGEGSLGDVLALSDGSILAGLFDEDRGAEVLARTDTGLTTISEYTVINETTGSSDPTAAAEFQGETYIGWGDNIGSYDALSKTITPVVSVPSDGDPVGDFVGATDTHLYFTTGAGSRVGLWAWNGSTDPVLLAVDGEDEISRPGFIGVRDGRLYFTDNDGRLIVSDGTPTGTVVLAADSVSSSPRGAIGDDGVVFTRFESGLGDRAWVTDGTVAGTRALGVPEERPRRYTSVDGDVYISAGDAMWRSSGGAAAAVVVPSPVADANVVEVFDVDGVRYLVTRPPGRKASGGLSVAAPVAKLFADVDGADVEVTVANLPAEAFPVDVWASGGKVFVGYRTSTESRLAAAGVAPPQYIVVVMENGVEVGRADLSYDGLGDVVTSPTAGITVIGSVDAVDDGVDFLTHIDVDGTATEIDSGERIDRLTVVGNEVLYAKNSTELGTEPYRAGLPVVLPPVDALPDVVSLDPARLLDSRVGGETIDGDFELGRRVAAGETVELDVLGRGGVPASGVGSVVLNATLINPGGSGFVSIFPCGDLPNASSMNAPAAGGVVANEVIAKVSPAGTVCLFTSVETHLAADVTGWVPSVSGITSLDPSRLLDSRVGGETIDGDFELGRRVAAGETVELDVLGRGGVPGSGVGSVVLNATLINPGGGGFVSIFPCGDLPNASSMNAPNGGGVVANEVIAKVSATGTVCLFTSVETHLAADVTGYIAT